MIPLMSQSEIENICKTFPDEVSHSKITRMLAELNLYDIGTTYTKRERTTYAITRFQNLTKTNYALKRIIEYISKPSYIQANQIDWCSFSLNLNRQLQYHGLKINNKGILESCKKTETYSEGQTRYHSLQNKLSTLAIHPKIFTLCKPEILNKNYFHLVFEASKVALETVRNLSGLNKDGNQLIQECFSGNLPILVINQLKSDTDKSEQAGLKSLLHTIVYLYRNPKAHELKAFSVDSEIDAITALIMISKALYLLDSCHRTR